MPDTDGAGPPPREPAPLYACFVVWNQAEQIVQAIRSVAAYVSRVIVVDGAFSTNPAPGPVASTDGTREAVERACGPIPLTYIVPDHRLEEHTARNALLDALPRNAWTFLLDSDEILVGDHSDVLRMLANLPELAVLLNVYTTAVMFEGMADKMDQTTYETAPIITTCGVIPRLVKNRPGLRFQRVERSGVFVHNGLFVNGEGPIDGKLESPIVVNQHVRQSYAAYQADYAWEAAQRAGAR